ncbi:MAG: hypothetical protein Q8936_19515 [Bacillota bacterium]|nr:hypothetical protein [Bacillota bacterium]
MTISEEQIKKKAQEAQEKRNNILKYAKAMTNIPIDSVVTSSQKNKMMTKYDKETIRNYLENPYKSEQKLREVIDYLCTISPQFCRLIEYIPNMALIIPFVKQNMRLYKNKSKSNKAKTDYEKMCDFYDTLDIKTTSMKILKDVFKYGVFYGIEVEGLYSTYIKKLDPYRCKIVSEGELGLGIAFDCAYFAGNEFVLEQSYPPIFKQIYADYQKGIKHFNHLGSNWQPLPVDQTICIKYDITNLDYSVPPYVNIFSALYDLEEFESLNKAKVTAENYTLIGLKIPLLTGSKTDTEDAFAISNDMIDATTDQLDMSLPPYMGYFTTPTEIFPVKASTAGDNKIDNVSNAVKNVWNATGFAESIFGVNNNNSGTLDYSIRVDEQILFPLYRQLEKYWGFKIKQKFKNNFKLELLNITWFNLEKMIGYYVQQSQFSIPVAIILPLLLGFEISDINDLTDMQEQIFEISTKWKPLASSNTTAGDKVGAPKKDQSEISASGEKTRENDSNNKR